MVCYINFASIGLSTKTTANNSKLLSLVTMTPAKQQRPFRSREELNGYSEMLNSNTKCIQSECSIYRLSVQVNYCYAPLKVCHLNVLLIIKLGLTRYTLKILGSVLEFVICTSINP